MTFFNAEGWTLASIESACNGEIPTDNLVDSWLRPRVLVNVIKDTDDLKLFLSFFSEDQRHEAMDVISSCEPLLANILVDIDSFGLVLKHIKKEFHERILNYVFNNQQVYEKIIDKNNEEETVNLANSLVNRYGSEGTFSMNYYWQPSIPTIT
ncbi:hypothetical protein [Legionella saoudiensis]|uniref:hypothetical protein n=1 Tax=Legionella saoudiensis TaxID=1750561 RepID=UPI00072FE4BA|nr:hypothetical protein [Legionella saoudiensis]